MNNDDQILVTGGTGFVGSHLIELLVNSGFKNIHTTTYEFAPQIITDLLTADQIHKTDLTNYEQTNDLIKKVKPKFIFHLAGWPVVGSSFKDAEKLMVNTSKMQLSLYEAINEHSPEARILSIGTALQYKSKDEPLDENTAFGPENPYAVSKILQEMIGFSQFKSNKLDIVFTRSFNHIGERQAPGFVLSDFCQQIVEFEKMGQGTIKVGNLEAIRDFTDVKDIALAYLLLMEKGQSGEVYNVGFGKGISIQELLDKLISFSKAKIEITVDKNKFRPVDVKKVIAKIAKIKNLGWNPEIKLEETLERTLNWWRKNL
jgi:GDP-4-dehydro-6-deoxy-D-mannose reductase